ncbi:hypothetical protein AWM68_17445 [Fictibacillus phosphorivorans]|uniref:Uncharacterized protein n=1 Tax=Fictibacillus phosphorivorans TaxID=1221500 RepID=A0A163S1H3_9BACL|nr:hypothetical protein AWM68_17445 [Fictibacillus phosphorivorans]
MGIKIVEITNFFSVNSALIMGIFFVILLLALFYYHLSGKFNNRAIIPSILLYPLLVITIFGIIRFFQ